MTTFSGSPRLQRGYLLSFDQARQRKVTIVFQYNPETVTRRLDVRATGQEGDRAEAIRLTGTPRETISFSVEIDAADQLEAGDSTTLKYGIYPVLSALELLLYPSIEHVKKNLELAQAGNIEIIPPEAPLTILVWGTHRTVPVGISGFSITEEAYDTMLNPIRAKIDLSLNVLSYSDLKPSNFGFHYFMAHHEDKEFIATRQPAFQVIGSSSKIY
jgi:hypothetical protein